MQPPPDNDVIKAKIIADTGINFNFISPPSSDYTTQLHLMLSSGNYPDIVAFNLPTDPFVYADQGILLDLTPYMGDMPTVTSTIPSSAIQYYNYNGQQIAVPKWTSTKRYNLYIRQDWLDELGLNAPVTLQDFHDVAKAFTTQDPDKNGQNDTYGISGLGLDSFDYIFGAYGSIIGETSWNAPSTHCNIYFGLSNGHLVPYATQQGTLDALTLLNQWYNEGIIDPNFASYNDAQLNTAMETSRIGITTYWWNWNAQRQVALDNTVPNGVISTIAPPTGPNGQSGLRAVPEVVAGVSVMSTTKYPDLAAKLLDYFNTEEGMMTSYTGVENVHWTHTNGQYLTTPQFDVDNQWIQWYFLFENEEPLYKVQTYLAQSRRDALNWNVVRDYADGMVVQAKIDYQADLQSLIAADFVDFITGKQPLSNFNQFVSDFMSQGGQEWTDQVDAIYQKEVSTNTVPVPSNPTPYNG